ncbi:hypothetical protein H4R18_005966 [Coemansia javaensis]|uniref:AA9 family lytic polysaccharide monooxygenase n=1 Tax=Coemansia javaensis TaxID=2761396 RepID=A0A9W8H105_9FUNG|nr:hypothetical protein H4R18_005973 [Coemansia javaensis]KAJ2775641.1 hypothetical protein H4R18_005966 [Coemansia javaensis]
MRAAASSRLVSVAVLGLLVGSASAHTIVTNVEIGGTELPTGQCIRTWWPNLSSPVQDLTSTDLRCRTSDPTGASTKACSVAAGDEMSVYYHRNVHPGSDVISASHIGPVAVYLAPLSSNGEGSVWVKIYEDGFCSSKMEWATEKLIKANGKLTFTIPSELQAGNYLLRPEAIALHGAASPGGAQFFPNCIHLTITGKGQTALPQGVAIPGTYKANDPGIL